MDKKILGLVIGSMFLTLVALFAVVSREARTAEGSVFIGQEYNATSTDSTWNSKQCNPMVATSTASMPKTLGSVIVTLTSNAPLYIYDATTTGPHSMHATTTIAAFRTTSARTYTFDVRAKYGICIVAGESTVGVASTTITYRQ